MKNHFIKLLLFIIISLAALSCDQSTQVTSPYEEMGSFEYAGKTYHKIRIGCQIWMKENLDVGKMIPGDQNQANNGVIEKYYYNNDSINYSSYGALYQWKEAMQYTTGGRGICPEGWHIPTREDVRLLKAFVNNNSNSLKAFGIGSGNGIGTNESKFNAQFSGMRLLGGGFDYLNTGASFWTSNDYDVTNGLYPPMDARYFGFSANSSLISSDDWISQNVGFSVRCIKDY